MSRFVIQPHGRLHEFVAAKLGFFEAEGLDYAIEGNESFGVAKTVTPDPSGQITTGAFESYMAGGGHKGQRSDISCACHWAVNQASASNAGQMWGGAYIVSPAGIMVPSDSDIRHPRDLAGREIAVGYHSGSHFTTVQALEPFLSGDDIRLKFVGPPWDRVDAGIAGNVAATSVWGITYLASEQLGLRKVLDCSFMMAFLFPSEVKTEDVQKYMSAMKRAQMEIDLFPEKYKELYREQIPERYRDALDVRLFSAGERIVFLPYTRQTFERTQEWIRERGLFDDVAACDYDRAVCTEGT